MQKEYASIAYSIGRAVAERRKTVGWHPLSDRLLDLLDKLHEKEELESSVPASQTKLRQAQGRI